VSIAAIGRRQKPQFNLAVQRLAELNKLFRYRYGGGDLYELPDDDSGRHDLLLLLHHHARLHGNSIRMRQLIKARAPWMRANEVDETLCDVARPISWRADPLAKQLGLTEAERRRLSIRTIGAIDMTKEERRQAAKLRNRQRMRVRRRAKGAKARADYVANSTNQSKPWLALGISRRTWYRQRQTVGSTSQ
jgi:hypothetical protein